MATRIAATLPKITVAAETKFSVVALREYVTSDALRCRSRGIPLGRS